MILFADGNTANSLQNAIGPVWQIFIMPQEFDPNSIDTLTLDDVLSQNIGVIKATSSILANKSLKFVQSAASLPNPSIGLEEHNPFDANGPLFRVGVKMVSGVGLSDVDKLRLVLDNNDSYVTSLVADDPRAVLTFDLSAIVDVASIVFNCDKPYTVECFTTQWKPFVAGTMCSRIRITLSQSCTTGNLRVYTNNELSVDSSIKTAAYAVLVSNKGQSMTTPLMLVDVVDWRTEGTMHLNSTEIASAQCPSLVHLELKPKLLEA